MSDVVARLQSDIHASLKSGDKPRLELLRLLLSAVKQIEIDSQQPVDDAGLVAVVGKMIKQRRESIRHYEAGNRADLAEKELAEIRLLEPFMPAAMDDTALDAAIAAAIAETQSTSVKDMGKVMAALKPQIAGRVDMSAVGKKVRDKLSA